MVDSYTPKEKMTNGQESETSPNEKKMIDDQKSVKIITV